MKSLYEIISQDYSGSVPSEEYVNIGKRFIAALNRIDSAFLVSQYPALSDQSSRNIKKAFISTVRGYFSLNIRGQTDVSIPLGTKGESIENAVIRLSKDLKGVSQIGRAVYEGSKEYLSEQQQRNQTANQALFLEYNRILRKLRD